MLVGGREPAHRDRSVGPDANGLALLVELAELLEAPVPTGVCA